MKEYEKFAEEFSSIEIGRNSQFISKNSFKAGFLKAREMAKNLNAKRVMNGYVYRSVVYMDEIESLGEKENDLSTS